MEYKPSKELLNYLREWYDWAISGNKHHDIFRAGVGLCNNSHNHRVYRQVRELLQHHFGSDWVYPFGGEAVYDAEILSESANQNTARLDFVLNVLKEHGAI